MLQRCRKLGAKALPQAAERSIERQCAEVALAGAKVAGSAERIALSVDDQDLVLEHADEVVAEVELEQSVAEQRMFDRRRGIPSRAAAPGPHCCR